MVYQSYIRDLIEQFPAEMSMSATEPDKRKCLGRFLESKLDITSFQKAFRFCAKQLDFVSTTCGRKVRRDNGNQTPWFLIKQTFVTFSVMVRDLIQKEIALNPGKAWRQRGGSGVKETWTADKNFRDQIDRVYNAMGANEQFRGIEFEHFTWHPIEYKDLKLAARLHPRTKARSVMRIRAAQPVPDVRR